MKTFFFALVSIALLTFSGCYTQLMIEPDDNATQTQDPIYIPPPPPLSYCPLPGYPGDPIVVITTTGGGYSPVQNPQTVQQPTRESGYQRNGGNETRQDNSRNTGAQRNDERVSTPQTSTSSTQVNIPTRGNSATQPNTSESRRGGR